MNTSRKGFLSSLSLATAFAGCRTTVKGVQPTRFKPFEVPGLEPRPGFWKVRPSEIVELCESATRCSRKEVICHTPLGYPPDRGPRRIATTADAGRAARRHSFSWPVCMVRSRRRWPEP